VLQQRSFVSPLCAAYELASASDKLSLAGRREAGTHARRRRSITRRGELDIDTKPAKTVARKMILMSREITAKLPEVTGKPAAEVTRLRCATCHRGVAIPKLLPDILTEAVNKSGAVAAVQQYRDLRKQYYGGQSYDFSENALVPVALQLTNANKPDDALALLQLNAELNPNSVPTYGGMAQAYLKKNDKENAVRNFEKVISIDPNNQQAKRQLEQLKNGK